MAERMRFRYRRELADGSNNETTSRKTFEKWLNEAWDEKAQRYDPAVRFYVAWCRWVEAAPAPAPPTGTHVTHFLERVQDVDAKENR